jgi:hypothetical protein
MSSPVPLFQVALPKDYAGPRGVLRYCSYRFAKKNLPAEVMSIIDVMRKGIESPRITYLHQRLRPGRRLGLSDRFHVDVKGVHRVVSFGGTPPIGEDGTILSLGTVWEYDGTFRHQSRATETLTLRTLLRVSRASLPYRDRWEGH